MMSPKLQRVSAWAIAAIALCLFVRPCAALPLAPAVATPEKVILDTDIADDIDDAYALALLASAPHVKLLG